MRAAFGVLSDGTPVDVLTLRGAGGVEVRALTYGCTIVSLLAPDARGHVADVALGFPTLDEYVRASPYFGAIVGRYANRIAAGRLPVAGQLRQLTINEPPNHLHGGWRGFDKQVWQAEIDGDGSAVCFRHTSPAGHEGYPGTLDVEVTYQLNERNELSVAYAASTDAPTAVNLTQHTYFNLRGEGDGTILDHLLQMSADAYLPVSETLIPTGDLSEVAGTPFDFRRETAIGSRIDEAHEQLRRGRGYDHTFVVRGAAPELRPAARLRDPFSGRTLEVSTTEPGLQFYAGNVLDGRLTGKSGRPYPRRSGLCLETQHYPDSPNHPGFPSTILLPGRRFASRTVFAFGV